MTYIEELIEGTREVRRLTKAGLGKAERQQIINRIASKYALDHSIAVTEAQERSDAEAERLGRKPTILPFNPPNAALLEKLTDLLLHEELTDTASNKATKYEYPFLSEYQLARRREGAHEQTGANQKGEVTLTAASNVGLDGKDYRIPVRKVRSVLDNIRIDSASRSRNAEIKQRYNDFIKPQPVITYKAGERV